MHFGRHLGALFCVDVRSGSGCLGLSFESIVHRDGIIVRNHCRRRFDWGWLIKAVVAPGAGFPERVAAEGVGGDQVDEAENEHSDGEDEPATFGEIEDGVEELDEGDDGHELTESAPGAEEKEGEESQREGSVAGGEVAGVDADCSVDAAGDQVAGGDELLWLEACDDGAHGHEDRAD